MIRKDQALFLRATSRRAMTSPIRWTMPTTSAFPMQNARSFADIPVFVQPFGNPCSWSSSSGTRRRKRPSEA